MSLTAAGAADRLERGAETFRASPDRFLAERGRPVAWLRYAWLEREAAPWRRDSAGPS